MFKHYKLDEAARYLRSKWHLRITSRGLQALWDAGRGPSAFNSSSGPEFIDYALDRWVQYRSYPGDRGLAEDFLASTPAASGSRPTWLLFHEVGYDEDLLARQLDAFDCDVKNASGFPALALAIAEGANLDGAILGIDNQVEASILVAATLTERRIPFIATTAISEPPSSLMASDTLRLPTSLTDLAVAIQRRLPPSVTARMDLSKIVRDEDEDNLELGAPESTREDAKFFEAIRKRQRTQNLGESTS